MKSKFRLAIFDFDGTLADSLSWFRSTVQSGAERFGYRRTGDAELEALRGLSTREVVRALGVPSWRMPQLARHFRYEAARSAHRIRMFPGAREALLTLVDHGVKVAIVSSNAEENVRSVIGRDMATRIFGFECGASLFGKAARLRRVIRSAEISAQQAIMIGDEDRDIEAARAARIVSGAVTWGYATRPALEAAEPDLVFDSFASLVRQITDAVPIFRHLEPGGRGD
ncbi:HAD hydrolase-like protein [Sphingomonas sp. MAH-20]|uniref:HAD hydrolase-like protein n=1 Tax=Sphingomonas horti TaxID=2682842 RepID=A0A6I4J1A5_9SPHN|nr:MULTISPECIES: HAD hydrolase-like protein [Sphingomonas]MBA2921062.1 HAD hydrolase-like protein [Sphingomonas sp. CGMCC 1.13658]MVO78127.1 HAD hydrolase-like protein [Sphingomonas horti]